MSTQSEIRSIALTVTIEEIDHSTASAFGEQVADGHLSPANGVET